MFINKSLTILLSLSLITLSFPRLSFSQDDNHNYSSPSSFDTGPNVSFENFYLQQQRLNTFIEQKNIQLTLPIFNPTPNLSSLNLNWNTNNFLNQRLDYKSFNVDYNEKVNRVRSFNLLEVHSNKYTVQNNFFGLTYTKNNNLKSYNLTQQYPSGDILNRSFHNARYKVNPLNLKYHQNLQTAFQANDRQTLLRLNQKPIPQKYLLFEFKEDVLRAEHTFLSYQIQNIDYDKQNRIISYDAVLFDQKEDDLFVHIAMDRSSDGSILKLGLSITNGKGFEFSREFKSKEIASFQDLLKFFYKNWIPILGDDASWITLKDLKLLKMPVLTDKDGKIPENVLVYDICKNIKEKFDPALTQESLIQPKDLVKITLWRKVKNTASAIVSGISRLLRNAYYMVTGKWDDVQDLRQNIKTEAKEKPTALYTLIKDKDINHLSLAELKNTYEALSKIPKEQILTDTIICGAITLKPRFNDNMTLNPIKIEVLKDFFKLKESIYLETKYLPESIVLNVTEDAFLTEAVFFEKEGSLFLKEGIIETSEGRKFYFNSDGLVLDANKIVDNFITIAEIFPIQKELLVNINTATLKDNIAQFNLLFGADAGELHLNDSDLSFLQSLVQDISANVSNVLSDEVLSMRAFLTDNANALQVIAEGAGKIEIAQSALSDFNKRVNELSVSLGQTSQTLSKEQFEIVKDKISELDYIACQLVMDELTKMGTPFIEGAVKGDFIENPTWKNIVGQIIGGLNPADFIADGRDIAAGCKKMAETKFNDGKFNTACAAIGLIPYGGNFLKWGVKSVFKGRRSIKPANKLLSLFTKTSPENIVNKVTKTNINNIQKCTLRTSKGLVKYYVRADGAIVPSKAYRYISSKGDDYKKILKSGINPPNDRNVVYFSFDKYNEGFKAKDTLQLPGNVDIRLEFDTFDYVNDIKIPFGNNNMANYLEPITKDFKNFGKSGGGTQAILYKEIKIKRIVDLTTNTIIKEFP